MERYVFVAATILLSVYGQLIMKARATVHSVALGGDRANFLLAMFVDPWVISSLAAAIAASATWMLSNRSGQLSQTYPFMALSFVLVPMAALVLFGEKVSAFQSVGLALIVVGVVLATSAI